MAREQHWQCRICASSQLLWDEHRHCPNCSHERDYEEPVFAVFGASFDTAGHCFEGNEAHCCGKGWSDTARYCGSCGTRLVRTPSYLDDVETLAPAAGRANAEPRADSPERGMIDRANRLLDRLWGSSNRAEAP